MGWPSSIGGGVAARGGGAGGSWGYVQEMPTSFVIHQPIMGHRRGPKVDVEDGVSAHVE